MKNFGYCRLTTTGRKTGNPHAVEVTFHREGKSVYMLSRKKDTGRKTDWYHNLEKNPKCTIEIDGKSLKGKVKFQGEDEKLEKKIRDDFAKDMGQDHYDTWYKDTNRIPVVVEVKK